MRVDLSKITKDGKALLLAYDQGMEHGPTDFNDENVDPQKILDIAESGFFTGVIFQKGIAEKYYSPQINKVPLIVKLNGKTNLVKDEDPYSPQVCSVEEAIGLGASAVGYTIYVGSEFESKMVEEFGRIEQEAEEAGIPVIAWMYPRGRNVADEKDPKVIAYAARVGLELGADMVKVNWPGDTESFRWVVESAGKTKVVVAGGSKESLDEFLLKTREILDAGGIGLAVGRNVWQAEDPLEVAERIAKVIWS
ncbi:MAG: class I fructose-bisphosphate aldolase [Patescibacteria group bacterium]|jgi:class I fructose-bisphosphate aldolase